tara:strand:- start:15 stop:194 length:180 start_codon:yes stop_codon:yes gene_type:complete
MAGLAETLFGQTKNPDWTVDIGQERMLKSFQINDIHNIYSTPPSLKRGAWRAENVSFRP